MRKQYHFRPGEVGLDAWDIDRLIERSAALPIRDVPLEAITDLDTPYWYDHGHEPTVRSVAEHARMIAGVDMSWPIILSHNGLVMHGMHRVARALLDGATTVRAVQFDEPIQPDHRNCVPEDLPYT